MGVVKAKDLLSRSALNRSKQHVRKSNILFQGNYKSNFITLKLFVMASKTYSLLFYIKKQKIL
jgi:hypothetical protein